MVVIISLTVLLTVSGFLNFILFTRLFTVDVVPGDEKIFRQSDQIQALLEAFQDEASDEDEDEEDSCEDDVPSDTRMNVAVLGQEAYWVDEDRSRLMMAPWVNDEVDIDRAKFVRTEEMTSDELEVLLKILDVLKEGEQ